MNVNHFRRIALVFVMMSALLISDIKAGEPGSVTPDYEREVRLGEQIVDMILDGDAVWLEANQR